ncbi:MAG: efflux RND transporter periplasmic adaptor subunit [Phycisphaerales bacterium]|nr:efflux RND transporter periplasmic adaptor subunit [Phycisphaerales bacterium]
MTTTDLSALTRTGAARAATAAVRRPPRRLFTRVALPTTIVLAAAALIAYAARETLRPAIDVTVEPVVSGGEGAAQIDGNANAPGEVVQAPGWIEADPHAIGVPALEPGVLKELLVLDGQRVEAGQIVARLVDDAALLNLRSARAEVAIAEAALGEARASAAAEEARAEEARDALRRVEPLAGTGAIPENELAALRLRAATADAAAATSRAAIARAEAELPRARVALDTAELALSRHSVRTPIGGVVLQRLVEPGQRLMNEGNDPFTGVVVRLYDPSRLQVRVDIPLPDAAKVSVGDEVEVSTETRPGRTFKATLTRFVHEADIQKNTVQIKAAIAAPVPELKPDMLAKARIITRGTNRGAATHGGEATRSDEVMLAPRAAVTDVTSDTGVAWVIDRQQSTADRRTLRLGRVTSDRVEVLHGLRHGDRVIVNPPPGLTQGTKVRVTNEGEVK